MIRYQLTAPNNQLDCLLTSAFDQRITLLGVQQITLLQILLMHIHAREWLLRAHCEICYGIGALND